MTVNNDDRKKEEVISSDIVKTFGDYTGARSYLNELGAKLILPTALSIMDILAPPLEFTRVVELGAGFGWMGRGISSYYKLPYLSVDLSDYAPVDIIADIESPQGQRVITDRLLPLDLIVMSEVIHCLKDPISAMKPFWAWPMVVIEFWPAAISYCPIFNNGEKNYHLGHAPEKTIHDIFPNSKIRTFSIETHALWVITPKAIYK